MTRVSKLPLCIYEPDVALFPCGDANHNGHPEVYALEWPSKEVVGFENTGGNTYRKFSTGVAAVPGPMGLDDASGNGLSKLLVVQAVPAGVFRVIQSPDSWSLPRDSFWQRDFGQVTTTGFCDADGDGRSEIPIYLLENMYGISLYEENGNHGYDSVATLLYPPWTRNYYAPFAVGDFDHSGHNEVVSGTDQNAFILVFQATGDNQFVPYAVCTTGTEYENYVRYVAAAHDMDKNGWPEFIALVRASDPNVARLMVYEATGKAQFRCVWQTYVPFVWFASMYSLSVGDIDGDGREEFCYSCGGDIQIFKCNGTGSYEQVWSLDTCEGGTSRLYDLNRDGRAELIFQVGSDTPTAHCDIYEDTAGLGCEEVPPRGAEPMPIQVDPTVSAEGSRVVFSGLAGAEVLEVYRTDGSLVRRISLDRRQTSLTLSLRDRSGRALPAGTYFALVRTRESARQLKFCVLR